MCYHRSCIVTEDERVLFHPTSDHHTAIRAEYKIREPGLHHTIDHVALECVPVRDLFDVGGWEVKVDQPTKPKWFDTTLSKKVVEKLANEVKLRSNKYAKVYVGNGELTLPYLQVIPDGTILKAENMLMLGDARHVVRGCIFDARTIVLRPDEYRRWMEPPYQNCVFNCERIDSRNRDTLAWLERYNTIPCLERHRDRRYASEREQERLYARTAGMHAAIDMTNGPSLSAQFMQHFQL